MKKRKTVVDFRLLCFSKGQLIENTDVVKFYRNSLKNSICVEQNIKNCFENKVVINSQCLFDNQEIENDEDIETFSLFVNMLPRGTDVTLKPHPREKSLYRYDRFNWNILSNISYTQEEIFSGLQVKPKMVVGITSSTLINLHALFGIKTISLAKIFLKKNIPEGIRKDIIDFIKLYHNTVDMPENEMELKKLVEDVFNKRS